MRTLFIWTYRLIVTLIVVAVLGGLGVYYLASRSLPDYDKAMALDGLTSPVDIVRDTANVPHIFAENNEDVFFGLGYAHAQDRLWQMFVMRRTVQGRLSEVFGERTLEVDRLLRRLDLYTLSQRSVSAQTPKALALLEAYARGVNARVQEVNENALGRGAPEMFLFPAPFAAWSPADSLAILKLMSLQLSGHLKEEVIRARTSLELGDEIRIDDILPTVPGKGIITLPDYANVVPIEGPRTVASVSLGDLSPIAPRGLAGASNAFAAAPARSAAGGTLLANDPHLGLTAPTIWYLARMELDTGGVIGGTIPGLPAVLTGRSSSIGWGLTSSYLDDQDILMEEVNPNNPNEYKGLDGYIPFKSRQSIIRIKGQSPQTITLQWSENGPILPIETFDLAGVTPTGHVPALSWSALSDQDTSFSSGIALMKAKSVSEALEALKTYQAPAQNITLVDQNSIAMKAIGLMPKRDPNHVNQGRMPSLGWMPQNRWQGYFDYSQTPDVIDPVDGILGNTNNKITDAEFPNHFSYKWGDSQRIQRWARLMSGRKVHTRESFIEAQLDTVSYAARTLLPLVAKDLWFTGEAAPEGTIARQRQTALALLADWNGEMNEHMPEPLIYAAWMRNLQDRLIRDDLGPLADNFTNVEPLFIERVFRNIEGASAWCDIRQSTPIETCQDIARLALDDAIVWIVETTGTNVDAVRWGDAHQAKQDHPVLGTVPVLRYFVNIRQSTSGGDQTLMRGKTSGTDPDPFANVHAAGYRGVYDFADPDNSVFVTSTGQSGHFLSRYYENLGQLWRRGEYVPMSLDADLARAAAVGVTKISPRQSE